jgi:hypothetical protein
VVRVTFPSHSVAGDNLEYSMHDVQQSLVPGYILKYLYVLHQENAIHAQISQRKSKIIEHFDKEEKALYEDLTTGKKKVQERVQDQPCMNDNMFSHAEDSRNLMSLPGECHRMCVTIWLTAARI